ncbi:MAG: hypothetical protein HY436_01310 [Candidatus Liptonbacteria bacterium]|nr:hypothetical protein [Candidatus Liptonbacteria bacterium]
MRNAAYFFSLLLFLAAVHARAVQVGTQVTATAATTILTQSEYRWYENIDSLNPTAALASQSTQTSTPPIGTALRLRMSVLDTSAALATGATFKLQYHQFATSATWIDVGTSSAAWVFYDNPGVADGQVIAAPLLSNSDVGETYNESHPTAGTPNPISPGEQGEWDWAIKNNAASPTDGWAFRMVYSSGTALDVYQGYPILFTPYPASVKTATTTVATSTGATYTFTNPNGTECVFTIPAGYSSQAYQFRVFSYSSSSFDAFQPPPSSKEFAGNVYDFNFFSATTLAVTTTTSASVTVTCEYAEAEISGIDESTLQPYRHDGSSWNLISGSTVDATQNTVTWSTQFFSAFAIIGDPASSGSSGGGSSSGGGNLGVGPAGVLRPPAPPPGIGPFPVPAIIVDKVDLNGDRRVDMADFSILLFYFGGRGREIARYDLNGDGRVTLADLSILLYYWTV